jgi:hypothetical protein
MKVTTSATCDVIRRELTTIGVTGISNAKREELVKLGTMWNDLTVSDMRTILVSAKSVDNKPALFLAILAQTSTMKAASTLLKTKKSGGSSPAAKPKAGSSPAAKAREEYIAGLAKLTLKG